METSNFSAINFLVYIFVLQLIVNVTVILDIPYFRQVLGLIFLILIPGFLFLRLLKISKSFTETILFSIGSSLSIIMLLGILLNLLGTINFLNQPLSAQNIILTLNFVIILLNIFSYIRNKKSTSIDFTVFRKKLLLSLYLLVPLISVISVMFFRTFDTNIFLLFNVILIVFIIITGLSFPRLSSHYPLILFSIGFALLLSTTLISSYVYGADIQVEYRVFTETTELSYLDWQSGFNSETLSYKGMASITILPTVLTTFLNLTEVYIFKIIFSLIFSLVPIVLYQLYYQHWGKNVAFISSVLFIVSSEFYVLMTTVTRQIIAEFFFILLFLILLKKDTDYGKSNWPIVSLFMIALAISHYSTNYLFLFIGATFWFFSKLFFRHKKINLDLSIFSFSFVVTFIWYLYLIYGPFQALGRTAERVLTSFLTEFSIGANDQTVQRALGGIASPSPMHTLGKMMFYVIMFLMLIGFISFLFKWKNKKIGNEYGLLIFINMGLLASAVIIPEFVNAINMERMYHLTLFFLAPLFVLGIETIFMQKANFVSNNINLKLRKEKKKIVCYMLTAIILVGFFLFQSGFIYEITDDPVPSSFSLSRNKLENSIDLVHESDFFSANWLSIFGGIDQKWTWADTVSLDFVLQSYSSINRNMILLLSNTSKTQIAYDTWLLPGHRIDTNMSYIYFRQYNVVQEKIAYDPRNNIYFSFNENPILNNSEFFTNRIYSNGVSEVYYQITK